MIEYSLLTWAGLGSTVTFTDAGDVVNFTAHGAPNGHAFQFPNNAGNTLPTGLSKDTTYYLRQGADANKFTIHSSQADAIANTGQVTFTGTGSGTHKVIGAYWVGLDSTARARYGTAGSERVYATMALARNAFEAQTADTSKTVVLEIYDKFTDTAAVTSFSSKWYSLHIETMVNGIRTPAFHNGVIGSGYVLSRNSGTSTVLTCSNNRTIYDGIEVNNLYVNPTSGAGFAGSAPESIARNCITKSFNGISMSGSANKIYNNIAYGCAGTGIVLSATYAPDTIIVYNNIAAKCGVGFGGANSGASAVNNIAIGNTTNWGTAPTASFSPVLANNAGISTDTPWGINPIVLAADGSDFIDYANNDFRPALSTSPQVDTGIEILDGAEVDIIGNTRPNYEAATYPNSWDIGAFEFDHGEGETPISATMTISPIISGSDVVILEAGTATVLESADQVSGTSYAYDYTNMVDVDICVYKSGYEPFIIRNYTLTENDASIPVAQRVDRNYINPA